MVGVLDSHIANSYDPSFWTDCIILTSLLLDYVIIVFFGQTVCALAEERKRDRKLFRGASRW